MAPITPINLSNAGAYAASTGATSAEQRQQKFQIAFGQGSNTGKTTEGPSFTQLVAAAASQGGDSFKTTRNKQEQPAFGSLPKAAGGNPFQQALEKEASNPFALA